ncbi:MAG: A/G-specific adenine glycosylase [Oscillospiraceae bacterium]|nr:A/G-specific adenine glycosylase [Oscillospiraceae bacterium]
MDFEPKNLVEPLLRWFAGARRPLPWRGTGDPYAVWISEVMLQQTRIETVIPYYLRFLKELPDPAALAAVSEDRLLKLWEGLGYYSRARNLKKAAQVLTEQYGGRLPADLRKLRALPGVGDYSAGAIASIAFGLPEPAVDGNVLRVFARLTACGEDVLDPKLRARVRESLRAVYPAGPDAGALTEALMELGERVCLPGAPLCGGCPLALQCLAHAAGRETDFPVRRAAKERRVEHRTVLVLRCGGRRAIRRRPERGLLAGLWELPALEGFADEAAVRRALEEWGLRPLSLRPCGEAKHVFTHVEWRMRGWLAETEAEGGPFVWEDAAAILSGRALPSAFRAYIPLLR